MNVAIIKYNAGNVCSIQNALKRLGVTPLLTDEAEVLKASDKIIFPGVGEASSAMRYLREHHLDALIKDLKQPLLGICLGMQLLCSYSEENDTECIGIFDQKVRLFRSAPKIPQIGWNSITQLRSPLFEHINNNDYVYFVHSYYAEVSEHTIATTNYGTEYSSALQRNNFYATQFHPEKSGRVGEQILANFINL